MSEREWWLSVVERGLFETRTEQAFPDLMESASELGPWRFVIEQAEEVIEGPNGAHCLVTPHHCYFEESQERSFYMVRMDRSGLEPIASLLPFSPPEGAFLLDCVGKRIIKETQANNGKMAEILGIHISSWNQQTLSELGGNGNRMEELHSLKIEKGIGLVQSVPILHVQSTVISQAALDRLDRLNLDNSYHLNAVRAKLAKEMGLEGLDRNDCWELLDRMSFDPETYDRVLDTFNGVTLPLDGLGDSQWRNPPLLPPYGLMVDFNADITGLLCNHNRQLWEILSRYEKTIAQDPPYNLTIGLWQAGEKTRLLFSVNNQMRTGVTESCLGVIVHRPNRNDEVS